MQKNIQEIKVDLGARSYPIFFVDDYGQVDLKNYILGKQILIVSNTKVAPLYLDEIKTKLFSNPDYLVETLILPDGEEHKTLETANKIWTKLLELNFNRDATLVALGGGVIGDMVGFAAAAYQRGANFIQIPTTLLAMVDASIGGKTGVNHPLGKNMIGAFLQPKVILMNAKVLNTLEDREFKAGLGEVIKYGLLGDVKFFEWLEQNTDAILQKNPMALTQTLFTSCNAKARLVEADETEFGSRALLNLGHTYGHAIETFLGYGKWLHGEAVAAGMVLAAKQSEDLGWLSAIQVLRIEQLLQKCDLPIQAPKNMNSQDFINAMARDKKNRSGLQKLILLKDIGKAEVVDKVDPKPLLDRIL